MLSIVSTILMLPLIIFAIPYIGWLLAILALPLLLLYIVIVDLAVGFATSMVNIYVYAGIAVSFVAYAKSDDCEKVEADVEAEAEAEVEAEAEDAAEKVAEDAAEPEENTEVEA